MNSNSYPQFYDVTVLYHVQIPARDGVLLSANLWMPTPRHLDQRFPAILEMIPYRKDDWRFCTDHGRMNYLAQRGYVCCRLDVRGTGSSGGIALDEYSAAETQDGYDGVEWLAAQDWSNGNVGMWGISWGGFAAIQVAMLQPPHLKAIVPMYASDDRYTDDVHYIGGCMVVSEFAQYAASQIGMNALPPSPRYFPDTWQTLWRERLNQTPPWVLAWLRNQTDGPYWRHNSLAPDYERIQCAIFHIAGWHDGYVDCAVRMHEKCTAPRKTLIGPWVHTPPDIASPGPNLDWLHEMVCFFDYWLKGIDNDAMDDPTLVVFRREYMQPGAFVERLNGEWIGVRSAEGGVRNDTHDTLGSNAVHESQKFANHDSALRIPHSALLFLNGANLTRFDVLSAAPYLPPLPQFFPYPHRPTLGTHASLCWGGGAGPNGLGRDLRPDEALSLTFTSDPVSEPLDIFGFPEVLLHLQCSAPVAHVIVRLCDVAPDSTSAQVCAGVLNLTHRHSHSDPQPINAAEIMAIRLKLRAACYRFLPGQRIRLSIASAYCPVVWPSPYRGDNILHCSPDFPSQLSLPLLDINSTIASPIFKTTVPALIEIGNYQPIEAVWEIIEDVIAGTKTVHIYDGEEQTLPNGDRIFTAERLRMKASAENPAVVSFMSDVVYRLQCADQQIEISAKMSITSDQAEFQLKIALDVQLNGGKFFEQTWEENIARQLC